MADPIDINLLRDMLAKYAMQSAPEQSPLDSARAAEVPTGDYRQRWDMSPTPETPNYRGDPFTTSKDGQVPTDDVLNNYFDRQALERILSGGR